MELHVNTGRAFEFSSWNRGDFLDRWSLLHIFWGALFAVALRFLNFSKAQSFFILLTAAILWEVYERLAGVLEPIPNSIVDILLNGVGFWLIYYLIPVPKSGWDMIAVFICVAGIVIEKFLSRR